MRRPPPIVVSAIDFVEIMAEMKCTNEEPLTENEQVAYDAALRIANLYFLGEIMDHKPAELPSET